MQMAVRSYVDGKKASHIKMNNILNFNRILVFDTETTTDMYQNLKFGYFEIYQKGIFEHGGIFYNPEILTNIEIRIIKSFCKNKGLDLYTRKDFVENIFYTEIYSLETLCIGFNLPFDLSRLAIDYGSTRNTMKDGFSLNLSENKKFPRIKIKYLDRNKSFIQFANALKYCGEKSKFRGNFLDLKTLTFALTNEGMTLAKACKVFNTNHKKIDSKHGKITSKYIDYNINDVKATYDLFLKLKDEYKKYSIKRPITKIYSPASIGKACLSKFGIKTFFDKNPMFPKKLLGYLMTTYYGGRCEVKIRKTPTKITLIDFLSMYPTVCTIQNLWKFLISDHIDYYDDTEHIKDFVDKISLKKLNKKSTWKKLNAIVEIEPDKDILPVRAKYNKNSFNFNIGINHITSEKRLWYTLSDIVASKLLTEKTPKIIRAIRFIPIGIQSRLTKSSVFGIDIDPTKEDFFKILIEKKKFIQLQQKLNKNSKIKTLLKSQEKGLKIIANSTSYGIFVEINSEKSNKNVKIYGLDQFLCETSKLEKSGQYFNPIIAVLITSASRLILAITETILKKYNETYAFCDTDSMAVQDKYVKEIQDFFQMLSPYKFRDLIFKIDEDKNNNPIKNIWFYGISSKRYVLYEKNGKKINIIKYSSHGLGHLLNPFGSSKKEVWQGEIWTDIIREHYGIISKCHFDNKYSSLYGISQLTASKPSLIKRFSKFNLGKEYKDKLKPFNFILIGFGNNRNIKPSSPFSKNPQEIVYNKFVDYSSGKIIHGLKYWKSLDTILEDYKNHRESKFDGDDGLLKRKDISIDGIIHIGKECNDLEHTGILTKPEYSIYQNNKDIVRKILKLKPKDVKKYGIRRNTLWYIKKRIKLGKSLNLSSKITTYLEKCMNNVE